MPASDIPEVVKSFLISYIESFTQLELLLLLHSRKDLGWTIAEVDRELRLGLELARKQLALLQQRGLLALLEREPTSYRYDPTTEELRQAVDALAATYKERRVSVTSFIYSNQVDSIRNFAEAFRLRRDE